MCLEDRERFEVELYSFLISVLDEVINNLVAYEVIFSSSLLVWGHSQLASHTIQITALFRAKPSPPTPSQAKPKS